MARDDEPTERLASGRAGRTDAQYPTSIEELESLPADPDPKRNLGYETTEWERFGTADNSGQLVFLPSEEEMLRRDAFVIVDQDDLTDLRTIR